MSEQHTQAFLAAEADAAERGANLTAVFGVVALVLAAGYMYWVNQQIQQLVRPDTVAEVLSGAAVHSLPQVSEDLRHALKDAAPELAAAMVAATVDGVGATRVRLEATFSEMTEEMSVSSARDIRSRLERHLAKEKGKGTPEEQLDRALAGVIGELELQVHGGPPRGRNTIPAVEAGVFTSLHESVSQLRSIDDRLRQLALKKDPDPSEHATRRLITAWLRLVEPEPSQPIDARPTDEGK